MCGGCASTVCVLGADGSNALRYPANEDRGAQSWVIPHRPPFQGGFRDVPVPRAEALGYSVSPFHGDLPIKPSNTSYAESETNDC